MKDGTLDTFADAASWLPVASGEAELKLTTEPSAHGSALRMDFDFKGGGGFVVARKVFAQRLPESYTFSFRVRGEAPQNKLEFKLADLSGKNVWRWQEENFEFTRDSREIVLKNSQIDFAWGPAGGGTLRKLGAVEFVLSAPPGGKGTVWLEDFRFEDRTCRKPPVVTASGSAKGTRPQGVLAKKGATRTGSWRSAPKDADPWLHIDFQNEREYGGLIIDWAPQPATRSYEVQASQDGVRWRKLLVSRRAEGARSFVYLPKGESRHLRLCFQGPAAIKRIEVQPFDFSKSQVDFLHGIAEKSPKGHYARWLIWEQSYWTCSGAPEGLTSALINEEGCVEPDMGTFSLEPFLHTQGKLFTWADAKRTVRQEEGGLAIPSAAWQLKGFELEMTSYATGRGTNAILYVRYRLTNTGRKPQKARLFVALRPYEVNPPWQAAHGPQSWPGLGGVSEIKELTWQDGAVQVNRDKWVVPLTKPAGFGAAAFEQGAIPEYLSEGRLPAQKTVKDDFGLASGALRFDLSLPPGATREVYLAVPFGMKRKLSPKQLRELAAADGAAKFQEAVAVMRDRLSSVSFRMPRGVASEAAQTFRTAAGQILINRDGPALQPGPRRYTRSWIRDGVIMGAALLRIGDQQALPEFVRWFAPFQREDGFVPCCVDRLGPDWLVEHDSHGQLIYGVMESFRFTADRAFLKDMWPYVLKAARFIEKLRAERLTVEYQTPEKLARYGLLPESASHEGYLAHPVHAYWDDFWALRGLRDATAMATELGQAQEARDFAALAFSFRETLTASINKVIADKGLKYVPGSVEWADFDPTATANAVTLLQGMAHLPAEPLDEMFAHFVRDFRRKHSGAMPWNNYTAYEIRIIGALVHLGRRAEALELLEFFLSDRRPRHWNQWPEISWKNPRSPGHLGDVPHTWIASEYMLVFTCLFAYEREADEALIIGAGVDDRWLLKKGGIQVQGLPTWYGPVDLAMKREADGTLTIEIGGSLKLPRGGFVVRPPGGRAIKALQVNGVSVATFSEREATIRELPALASLTFGEPLPIGDLLRHPPHEA